jgi:hypothetical protein
VTPPRVETAAKELKQLQERQAGMQAEAAAAAAAHKERVQALERELERQRDDVSPQITFP